MARRPVIRNLAARSPLMRKGGVHRRSVSAERRELGCDLDVELLAWELEREEEDTADERVSGNRDD